jgi:integrase/recombinase XerD
MSDSAVSKRVSRGNNSDLSTHIAECLDELVDRGYAELTVDQYRGSLRHFYHWVTRDKIDWRGRGEASVQRFLTVHLPSCDCAGRHRHDRLSLSAALHHLLRFLRTHGHTTARAPEANTIEEEVQRFDVYLDKICGLAPMTRRSRRDSVRRFLFAHFARGPIDLANCRPRQIRQFITSATQGWAPSSIATLCGALRSYLRFRALWGDSTDALKAAVPSVAQWRETSLPSALTEVEIERFLGAFDRRTTEGRRDYAMALCLADLGLRAGEVARIQLEDLNWRSGTLQLKGTKGRRIDELPLPIRTGQAIVQYLQRRTARLSNRALFVRRRPPLDAQLTVNIVYSVMRQAYARAGIAKPWSGTHCLRHSLACHLVNAGVPLKGIADVLRHRSLNTTTIYAKTNIAQLAAVALPWPGRVS